MCYDTSTLICFNNVTTDCAGPKKFLCNNGKCIRKVQTCDGVDNCGDRSDEDLCVATSSECLCGFFANSSYHKECDV